MAAQTKKTNKPKVPFRKQIKDYAAAAILFGGAIAAEVLSLPGAALLVAGFGAFEAWCAHRGFKFDRSHVILRVAGGATIGTILSWGVGTAEFNKNDNANLDAMRAAAGEIAKGCPIGDGKIYIKDLQNNRRSNLIPDGGHISFVSSGADYKGLHEVRVKYDPSSRKVTDTPLPSSFDFTVKGGQLPAVNFWSWKIDRLDTINTPIVLPDVPANRICPEDGHVPQPR